MLWNFLATHPVVMLTVGGALGTNARYFLGRWIQGYTGTTGFPWWTFLINVSGSFLLGLFAALWVEHQPEAGRRPYLFLGVGFCGGYTTYSSFEYEILQRTRAGLWGQVAAYVVASLVLGFAAVALGAWLGSRLLGGDE